MLINSVTLSLSLSLRKSILMEAKTIFFYWVNSYIRILCIIKPGAMVEWLHVCASSDFQIHNVLKFSKTFRNKAVSSIVTAQDFQDICAFGRFRGREFNSSRRRAFRATATGMSLFCYARTTFAPLRWFFQRFMGVLEFAYIILLSDEACYTRNSYFLQYKH